MARYSLNGDTQVQHRKKTSIYKMLVTLVYIQKSTEYCKNNIICLFMRIHIRHFAPGLLKSFILSFRKYPVLAVLLPNIDT